MSEPSTFDNYSPNQRGKLKIPEIGETVTVTLPGEITRAKMLGKIDDDTILCELGQPMAKSHTYTKGQKVQFKRCPGMMREYWGVGD